MVSVGFLTYLFSSADDQPKHQEQISAPADSVEPLVEKQSSAVNQ